ncbi:MAG: hypothetical protein NC388_06555 [Clostridium sp.]|nr:hypothetical protein [Clostridium sp.]
MRKQILSFICALMCWPLLHLRAQTLPTVSSEGNDVWYYILFDSADDVIAAKGEGEIPVVAMAQ